VVVALVLTTGAHWATLQVGAWVGMFARFSEEGSVGEAISKTFDGKHACRLCRWVKEGRAAENGKNEQAPVTKMDPVLPTGECESWIRNESGSDVVFAVPAPVSRESSSPPVPPPRRA